MSGPYTLLAVDDVEASVTFFRKWLDYEPAFESSWFHLLERRGGDALGAHRLAFMASQHPTQNPLHREPLAGTAVITYEVDDVDDQFTRFQSAHAPVEIPLVDEPWGQRHFMLKDPAGIWVDVVQQIEPSPDFWEQWA
ncbi:MAG: VOC family protein [Microthrixaceae bacterium]